MCKKNRQKSGLRHNRSMNHILCFFALSLFSQVWAVNPDLPNQGIVSENKDSFLDERIDYSRFSARVTDKDTADNIFKIKSENLNTKFLKIGDALSFHLPNKTNRYLCHAHVRSVEENYFSIYVNDLHSCFPNTSYFKRGTILNFISETMARRVFEASEYRMILLKRRKDYLYQLNDINHFVWSYNQERVKVAADYDQKILNLQKEKEKAIDDLQTKRSESLVLQTDLKKKLDLLDENLKFYTVERQELFVDRWNHDHDMGLPVAERPQELKANK